MEITAETIYWVTRADNFQTFFIVLSSILIFSGLFVLVVNLTESKSLNYWLLICPLLGLFLFFVACFIPSTKVLAAMYILPKVVNNEQIQQIPTKLLDLTNEWLEELKPKKEK